ncbi:regulator of G-protein signaling protein-like [Rhopilema esculentum]|uniref:regulator of G-protein signaling protein-like n=1 Tax=Rhopilema esculentum TaxID=499914 RepID=UPI0031E29A74
MKYKHGFLDFAREGRRPKKRFWHKMEDENQTSIAEIDYVVDGFSSEQGFKNLLEDEVFIDYFNTFLSLPVFAKRLHYRRDSCMFEMDVPSGHTCNHCSQHDVIAFAWKQRGTLFLKTDICNEYRLCKLLLNELLKANADDKYSLDLHREIGNVLSMQRLKAFFHESAGECLMSFWLAAERFRRQTTSECRRFLIREIQDKYIRQGAWLELQESIKTKFASCLDHLVDGSHEEATASVNGDLLTPCQDMALSCLTSYWLPKYLSHRSHKRQKFKRKWRAALQTTGDFGVKTQFNELLSSIKATMAKSPGIQADDVSCATSQEPELQFPSEKSSMNDVFSRGNSLHGNSVLSERESELADRNEMFTPDTVITLEDEESSEGYSQRQSHASHVSLRLPQLHASLSLVSATKIESKLPNASNLTRNCNQLAAVCAKLRDVSLSRALALTNSIRGSSFVDVETQFAFPNGFVDYGSQWPNKIDENLEHLWTALAADQLAGQPFCDYIRLLSKEKAFANIRFWAAAQGFLSSLVHMDTLTRRRQARALIHIYLLGDSPRKTCLGRDIETKICELLPNDLGYTVLNAACWQCAKALMPFWLEFLDLDDEKFAEIVSYRISSAQKIFGKDSRKVSVTFGGEYSTRRRKVREKVPAKHMWNALQLAISISVPQTAKPLLEGYEDVDDGDEEKFESSLQERRLRILNKQAAQALEDYRKSNPYQSAMAYYFYQQNLLLGNMGSKQTDNRHMTTITKELGKKHLHDNKPRLPRPRSFQEILHDPAQLEAFKKFLAKSDSEIPMLFWQSVESMRINTKEAKQRQHRANGIVKRFFGPGTNYGKALDCTADIVRDLPQMDKVTPAMLVSAQTCVTRSMEEKWFVQYLATFPADEELSGITKLPHFRSKATTGLPASKSIKHRNRALWKMFARNIVSFRRGIANHRVLRHFQSFLRYEHKMNVKRSKEQGEEGPERVLISNKLVSTEKLINDLRFWIEVDRYKEFADAVVLCAKLGNYTKDDELIVTRKAKAIVNCFVDSLVPPRIQINVPVDIADAIMSHVKSDIIERGLFHDAAFSVFSVLLHYWKRFCHYRILPKSKLPECPSSAKTTRSTQIERRKVALQKNQCRRVSVQPGDECTKIMFSLQNGIRIAIVPIEEEKKSCDNHKLPKINPFKLASKITNS